MIASIFRFIFLCKPLRRFYFGLHEKVFRPLKLFKGVTKNITFKKSFKLKLDINDWISQNLYFLGNYEQSEIEYIARILKDGDTFIDAGAHIGIFSLVASNAVGPSGKVYSFEPLTANYQHLENHIRINNSKNVTIEKLALSDKSGEIKLHINEEDGNKGMATAYPIHYTFFETVKTISLDAYSLDVDISNVKAIKMDIEGGEYPALLGMKGILKKYHPVIIIEISPEILKQTPFTIGNIESFLSHLSYKKMFLDETGELLEAPPERGKSCNYVFI